MLPIILKEAKQLNKREAYLTPEDLYRRFFAQYSRKGIEVKEKEGEKKRDITLKDILSIILKGNI